MNDKPTMGIDFWIEIALKSAADAQQFEAVCRYLRGEVERLGKMMAMADEVCPKCGCTFYYDEQGWTHEVTHE